MEVSRICGLLCETCYEKNHKDVVISLLAELESSITKFTSRPDKDLSSIIETKFCHGLGRLTNSNPIKDEEIAKKDDLFVKLSIVRTRYQLFAMKCVDVEKDLEVYEALKAGHSKLDPEHSRLQETHVLNTVKKLTKWIIDLQQLEELQNDHELLRKEDSENRNNIALLKTENDCLVCNLTTLSSAQLQNKKGSNKVQDKLSDYKTNNNTKYKIQNLKRIIRVLCRVCPSQPQENGRMFCNITYAEEE
ncbi:hypothetical protein ILUMI_22348 [Ignelater luminosus]|uniref:Uncharacterized protein n=1 Tax=Ignelater luminosus TaxID=2038154 RepID=A0A8K0CEJ5_IGNLU|nr:hypothetical protein ILUMI_22348 [Ignelater luminosus]